MNDMTEQETNTQGTIPSDPNDIHQFLKTEFPNKKNIRLKHDNIVSSRALSYSAFSKYLKEGDNEFVKYLLYQDSFSWKLQMIPGDLLHKHLLLNIDFEKCLNNNKKKQIDDLKKSVLTQSFALFCYNNMMYNSSIPPSFVMVGSGLKSSQQSAISSIYKGVEKNECSKITQYIAYKAFSTQFDKLTNNTKDVINLIREGDKSFSQDFESLYEFSYSTTYNGYYTTIKYDKLFIDYDNKIAKIIDLKTTGNIENTNVSIDAFNYDIQGVLSIDLLNEYLMDQSLDPSEFKISFDFLFVNKNTSGEKTSLINLNKDMISSGLLKMNKVYTFLKRKNITVKEATNKYNKKNKYYFSDF